ncbi:hypothetical protein PTI98_010709 [Pleurotus ostreatus]|nr:hypothetical protein PTI98_010709 [Pleurotus ostreatus]
MKHSRLRIYRSTSGSHWDDHSFLLRNINPPKTVRDFGFPASSFFSPITSTLRNSSMLQFVAASLILALSATAATFTVLDVDPGVAQSSDYIIVLHRLLGSSTLENDSDLDLRPIVPTFDINSPYSFSQ